MLALGTEMLAAEAGRRTGIDPNRLVAAASGWRSWPPEARDASRATSYGTEELLAAALYLGAAPGADPVLPGSGAAGGIGFATVARCSAKPCFWGFRIVADEVGPDSALEGADLW